MPISYQHRNWCIWTVLPLKTAKILKIETFNNEFNPNTGKEELKLNRAIDFKLENAALLELPVNCK